MTEASHSEHTIPIAGGPGTAKAEQGLPFGAFFRSCWEGCTVFPERGRAACWSRHQEAQASRGLKQTLGTDTVLVARWCPWIQPCLMPWIDPSFSSVHELIKSPFCLSQFGFDSVTNSHRPLIYAQHGRSFTLCEVKTMLTANPGPLRESLRIAVQFKADSASSTGPKQEVMWAP